MQGLVAIPKSALMTLARDSVKKDLTVFPMALSSYQTQMPEPIRLWREDDHHLYVPRGYYWGNVRRRFDPPFSFSPSEGRSQLRAIANPVPPRPQQTPVIEEAVQKLTATPFGGVILEMPTASGKSFSSSEIARRIGRKTLIVVHTTVLMEQWQKELKKFFPEWEIGRIQGPVVDVENKDVVVAMLQSVALKDDYPLWIYREFGTIIIDEVHLSAAKEFQKVFFKFSPKYFIGLTGTMQRADRAENVFIYGIGSVVKAMDRVAILQPTIYFIDTKFVFQDLGPSSMLDRQKVRMLSQISGNIPRNNLITQHACDAASKGRTVIVLSERVAHVQELARRISEELARRKLNLLVSYMVGTSTRAEREVAAKAEILVATGQLLSVGFDKPSLDTLLFASPIQSVFQSVGRILRSHDKKKSPMVLDYFESTSTASIRLAQARYKRYVSKRWPVKNWEMVMGKKK